MLCDSCVIRLCFSYLFHSLLYPLDFRSLLFPFLFNFQWQHQANLRIIWTPTRQQRSYLEEEMRQGLVLQRLNPWEAREREEADWESQGLDRSRISSRVSSRVTYVSFVFLSYLSLSFRWTILTHGAHYPTQPKITNKQTKNTAYQPPKNQKKNLPHRRSPRRRRKGEPLGCGEAADACRVHRDACGEWRAGTRVPAQAP